MTDWIEAPGHDFPLAGIQLHFRLGTDRDPVGKEGLTYLTARLMMRGAGAYDRDSFATALESLGGHLDIVRMRESIAVDGEFLSRLAEPWFDLLSAAVLHPRFEQEELDEVVTQAIDELAELTDSDESLGSLAFHRALFAPDARALPSKGTPASLRAITVDDLRACHARVFCRERLLVGAYGDLSPTVRARLEQLQDALPSAAAATTKNEATSSVDGFDIWLIDKPDRTQCQLFLGALAPTVHAPEHLGLTIGTTAFGGVYTSRLSQEIRETRGWSYAAWASYIARGDLGWWTARSFPAVENTFDTLHTTCEMIDALLTDGLEPDEHEFAVDSLCAGFAFRLQTDKRRMEDALNLRILGRPANTTARWPDEIRATTLEQTNDALAALSWPRGLCVLVGDADALTPQLSAWHRRPRIHALTPEDVVENRWP